MIKILSNIHPAVIFLVVVNAITFLLYGIDKFKAKHDRWRIPESVLLGMAAIGGSVGAWTGMLVWHHKTLHKKFRYGIPLIILAQIALSIYLFSDTIQAYIHP